MGWVYQSGFRRALVAGLLLVCAHVSFALDAGKSIGQYVHRSWQTEDGLPQNSNR